MQKALRSAEQSQEQRAKLAAMVREALSSDTSVEAISKRRAEIIKSLLEELNERSSTLSAVRQELRSGGNAPSLGKLLFVEEKPGVSDGSPKKGAQGAVHFGTLCGQRVVRKVQPSSTVMVFHDQMQFRL